MREHSFLRVSTCRTPLCTNKVLLPTIRCSHIQTRIYIDVTLTTRSPSFAIVHSLADSPPPYAMRACSNHTSHCPPQKYLLGIFSHRTRSCQRACRYQRAWHRPPAKTTAPRTTSPQTPYSRLSSGLPSLRQHRQSRRRGRHLPRYCCSSRHPLPSADSSLLPVHRAS